MNSTSARLKAVSSSIGLRLLIPLLLVVALVLAVHAYFSFRSTREHFLAFAASEADRSTNFIRRATHDGMLLNRLDDVQSTIEQFAQEPEIAAIRIYDKQGEVVISSARPDIGRRVALTAAPCAHCHTGSRGERTEASTIARAGDARVVRQVTVLKKEAACVASGCHDPRPDEMVLGVLEVEMSMLPLRRALAEARLQLVWTTLGLMLVIGIVASLIVRRLVHQPIARLKDGTRRVASGDLDTRIDVEGKHELAGLADDFNRMAQDLSRTQSELTRWSQTLEEKVVEKTDELRAAQRQVLHMEKMASPGKLSATVAHELNNPISGMLTYARLIERELAEQPLPDGARDQLESWLRLVQQECSRCGGIVKNLLVFARRDSTDMAPVDVNDVVRRSVMLIGHQLDMNGIRASVTYLERDREIVADPGQLEQALVALLINAAEAMSEGGELTVTLRGEGDGVEIAIADTGTGIAADILPLVFEPFFTTKNNESGAGLGLAVVYGIVHRHGGTIEVQSIVGAGTTFHLRFPRRPPLGEWTGQMDRDTEAAVTAAGAVL